MDTFTHDGLTFDVTDRGPADGPVVVLLHGFPQDRTAWDEVTPLLNAAGLRTLAPDQRGYSPHAIPDGRSSYTLEKLLGDTLALIDASGAQRVHLVGHDWGGAVAWAMAGRHPDRLESLTVCSTPHPKAMAWAFRHGDQARKSLYMLGFQVPWLAERLTHKRLLGIYRALGMPKERAAAYVARFPTPQSLTGPLGWYRAMPASKSMRQSMLPGKKKTSSSTAPRPDRRIAVPTTFVWGARDAALGRAAAEKTADYVSADYRFVQVDENHWVPELQPQTVADAVLARTGSAS